jgi:hypothetical protein
MRRDESSASTSGASTSTPAAAAAPTAPLNFSSEDSNDSETTKAALVEAGASASGASPAAASGAKAVNTVYDVDALIHMLVNLANMPPSVGGPRVLFTTPCESENLQFTAVTVPFTRCFHLHTTRDVRAEKLSAQLSEHLMCVRRWNPRTSSSPLCVRAPPPSSPRPSPTEKILPRTRSWVTTTSCTLLRPPRCTTPRTTPSSCGRWRWAGSSLPGVSLDC